MKNATVKKLLKKQDGQAAIEFITVVVVIFFFLFFMLSLSITLVVSDYIEYATFMSARTLKSMYSTDAVQDRLARQEFFKYAERVQGIARNFSFEIKQKEINDEQTWGVEASYDIDLFYLPPLFTKGGQPPSVIRLTAQAYLGRDPSFERCIQFFRGIAPGFGIDPNSGLVQQMADNAC
ncbi:MAG: hypothetical protein H6617_07505 [Bdellovibrionaceae bacterium]|nr:hypothetical protein [Bdellovibrionales bacterium]MCB9254512.1 hypothetical protein [Pseudobdellovibrionaceae bacterium]